jgi:hypothetical protein
MKRGCDDGTGFAYVSLAMRWSWGLMSLALFVGCGEGGPPLDELPLRDALRAEPEVVAGLSQDARLRLAARLETARMADPATDEVGDDADTPGALVAAIDRMREKRLAEPLMVGAFADGLARPVVDREAIGDGPRSSLPLVEGESAGTTAPMEARALEGEAGVSLRILFAASGARRLWRVVGWPVGALAIGDTVYVNASWLVALARGGDGVDGGLDGPPSSPRAAFGRGAATSEPIAGAAASATAVAPFAAVSAVSASADGGLASVTDGGESSSAVAVGEAASLPGQSQIAAATGGEGADGGGSTPPPPPPPTVDPSFWDACSAGADTCGSASDSCDTSTDDGSDDSCGGTTDDGSDDSCGGTTDDGSDDSCSGTTDDGSDDSCSMPPDDGGGCQVAPSRGRRRDHTGTVLWLLAPLGFLLGRRP